MHFYFMVLDSDSRNDVLVYIVSLCRNMSDYEELEISTRKNSKDEKTVPYLNNTVVCEDLQNIGSKTI